MASSLEKIPSKLIYKILKPIVLKFKGVGEVRYILKYGKDNLRQSILERIKLIGGNDLYDDFDYVTQFITINFNKFQDETFGESLIKPEIKNFTVKTKVSLSEYKTEYWESTFESYSEENAYHVLELLRIDGEVDYWEGDLVDSDVHDTEVNETEIYSVKPIIESIGNKKPLKEGVIDSISKINFDDLFKLRQIVEEEIKSRLKK